MTLEDAQLELEMLKRNRAEAEYERDTMQEECEYWEARISETLDLLERLQAAH